MKLPSWLDWWAFGRYNLGLSEDEFWSLTLAQFDALTKRYNYEQEWLDYRAALICAVIANVNRNPKKHKAFQPKDFMPRRQVKSVEELTPDRMLEHLRILNIAHGGKETIKDEG